MQGVNPAPPAVTVFDFVPFDEQKKTKKQVGACNSMDLVVTCKM